MHTSLSRLALAVAPLLLAACATKPVPYDYTAFRASQPSSILVLPPLNKSVDIRASYSVMASATRPLAESGYYVFPVAVVDQTFKENGLDNPADMHQTPLPKLREIFGNDAVMYITVEQYGTKYMLVDSVTLVEASGKLVDARTGALLWQGKASASDAEGRNNNSGGLVGLLVTALVRQIAGSVGDPGHGLSHTSNARLLRAQPNGLLYGPRSPHYQKDQVVQ
jgi:hypothetical protein